MLQSQLFGKRNKNKTTDAASVNHDLLVRAGFIDQLMAGVYSYLPLGLRTLNKISDIVREEMNLIDGQEINMPALQPKENWVTTGRWDTVDILFKIKSQTNSHYALGPTHEEVVVPLVKKNISSYRDLPKYVYQIQVKFRDELRAKAGLLRGREFLMKDLYSFHTSLEDLKKYYEVAKKSYVKIFNRCGLDAIITEASGGSFTKDYSHEFQVLTKNGEDTIFHCVCGWSQNKEIAQLKAGDNCPKCGGEIKESKAIEVGNIFDLGTKFSTDFNLNYTDEDGQLKPVFIGCYGIGISRLLGTVVEVCHDEDGIIWPKEIAPFTYHLLTLSDDPEIIKKSAKVYNDLRQAGKEVFWDDRLNVSAGIKLAEADLIGLPERLVISAKTKDKIEHKKRNESETKLIDSAELL